MNKRTQNPDTPKHEEETSQEDGKPFKPSKGDQRTADHVTPLEPRERIELILQKSTTKYKALNDEGKKVELSEDQYEFIGKAHAMLKHQRILLAACGSDSSVITGMFASLMEMLVAMPDNIPEEIIPEFHHLMVQQLAEFIKIYAERLQQNSNATLHLPEIQNFKQFHSQIFQVFKVLSKKYEVYYDEPAPDSAGQQRLPSDMPPHPDITDNNPELLKRKFVLRAFMDLFSQREVLAQTKDYDIYNKTLRYLKRLAAEFSGNFSRVETSSVELVLNLFLFKIDMDKGTIQTATQMDDFIEVHEAFCRFFEKAASAYNIKGDSR